MSTILKLLIVKGRQFFSYITQEFFVLFYVIKSVFVVIKMIVNYNSKKSQGDKFYEQGEENYQRTE